MRTCTSANALSRACTLLWRIALLFLPVLRTRVGETCLGNRLYCSLSRRTPVYIQERAYVNVYQHLGKGTR